MAVAKPFLTGIGGAKTDYFALHAIRLSLGLLLRFTPQERK